MELKDIVTDIRNYAGITRKSDIGRLVEMLGGGREAGSSRVVTGFGEDAAAIAHGDHYLLLAAIAVMILVPFAWMLSTSLKGRGVLQEIPPRWIPEQAFWSNYRDVLVRHHFLRYGLNSIYVSLMGAVGQLFTCSLAGFAFARLRFWGREVFFALLLATMMIPLQVMIIPEFLIMMGLGWIDHPLFLALIVPSWLAGSFGTFMLRQFFMAVPIDLDDAARIDMESIKSEGINQIETLRDFEYFLRDAGGMSRELAKALASRAQVVFGQREAGSDEAEQRKRQISEVMARISAKLKR